MKYYVILFDRKLTPNYINFHKEFTEHNKIRNWWHYIKSCYIVGTEWTANEIADHYTETAKRCGIPTTHLVLEVNLDKRQGRLSKKAWEWFRR